MTGGNVVVDVIEPSDLERRIRERMAWVERQRVRMIRAHSPDLWREWPTEPRPLPPWVAIA